MEEVEKMDNESQPCKWCSLEENEYGELWGPMRYVEELESYSCITRWSGEDVHLMVVEHKRYDECCFETGISAVSYCPWCGRRL